MSHAASDTSASGQGRAPYLCACSLLVLTTLAYLPALNAGFVWDDDFHVTRNVALRDLPGLERIWTDTRTTPQYYPLTHTSFWIQYQLWGAEPLPYHLLNVLLHAGSAILVWLVLARLSIPTAWLGAAIFALHPVHVESVAWITERKNVLSGFFYLAAGLAYLAYALQDAARRNIKRQVGLPLATLCLYACALLAKTTAASLPLVLAVLLLWKRRLGKRDLWLLLPMLAAGAVMGRLTALLEKQQVGASGAEWSMSLLERCLVASRALWFYLGKLVLPTNLTFVYPRWEIDERAAWQYLFGLALAAAAICLALAAGRWGWGPGVAFIAFILMLAPALGFFDVFPMRYSFVADHFQYLASIGPIAVIAVLLGDRLPRALSARLPILSRRAWRRAISVLVLTTLAALTFVQCFAFQDLESLWRHTLARNPRAWIAHYNLGKLLADRGQIHDAEVSYRLALAAKPDLADAHLNLANALAKLERYDEALEHHSQALRLAPENGFMEYNLALTLEQMGRREEALHHYREAIGKQPDLAGAHNNLAILLYERGEYAEAWREVERAHELGGTPHPDFVRALLVKLADPSPPPED